MFKPFVMIHNKKHFLFYCLHLSRKFVSKCDQNTFFNNASAFSIDIIKLCCLHSIINGRRSLALIHGLEFRICILPLVYQERSLVSEVKYIVAGNKTLSMACRVNIDKRRLEFCPCAFPLMWQKTMRTASSEAGLPFEIEHPVNGREGLICEWRGF